MSLPVYFDIDGTLTDHPSVGGPPNHDRIARLRDLISEGKEVVIWSATGTMYAREFAFRHGLTGATCIGKPQLCVDDKPNIRRDPLQVMPPERYFGV